MVRISSEEINAIRARADITDIISHYIPVQRAGKEYRALCPFHSDHDPSMHISPDLQIYKCFVCGNGGNVFSFVKNFEKISFPEAVGKVAEMIGFPLSVQPEKIEKPKDPHKEQLYRVLNETINFTMYQLDTSDALQQVEYLNRRGLTEDVRKVFQIGYNPYGNVLTRFLKAKGYADKDLVSANVVRINDRGTFDVFEGRITFPIHDQNGNPIGFSARTLDPQNPSKYINTNETDVFIKGDIVYNYHRARNQARLDGKVYVCEGVTDVIAFYRAGITNAVCTLGTSCTNAQIQLLKHIASKIVFCYDGDHAGQAATFRASSMAFQAGCDVSVVLNTTGLDPDEMIQKNGPEALKKLVSQEISRMEFVLHYLSSETNMNSYLEKKKMADRAMEEIRKLHDDTERDYFIRQLNEMTGFSYTTQPVARKIETTVIPQSLKAPAGVQDAEDLILSMMLQSPKAVRQFEEELSYLLDPTQESLAMTIIDLSHRYGKITVNQVMDEVEDQHVKDLLSSLAFSEKKDIPYEYEVMAGAIRAIKIAVLRKTADDYKVEMAQALNENSRGLLISKYNDCLNQIRRLRDEESRSTGN